MNNVYVVCGDASAEVAALLKHATEFPLYKEDLSAGPNTGATDDYPDAVCRYISDARIFDIVGQCFPDGLIIDRGVVSLTKEAQLYLQLRGCIMVNASALGPAVQGPPVPDHVSVAEDLEPAAGSQDIDQG